MLANCFLVEGRDADSSMHWHTECVMRMMFRSWSLAVQILVRERLKARCEELKSQTSNRPITLATTRKHQLVEAAVTELLWSRDWAERDTVGRNSASRRKNFSPSAGNCFHLAGRFRVEEIKELALERNISISGPDGALIQDLLRWCERQTETGTVPLGACVADVPITTTT